MCSVVSGTLAEDIVVPLGYSAKFSCCVLDNLPIWIINNTVYESSSLPNDYYLTYENECYVMVTTEVKLWMNSTTYSCYSSTANKRNNYHTVYVEFGKITNFWKVFMAPVISIGKLYQCVVCINNTNQQMPYY